VKAPRAKEAIVQAGKTLNPKIIEKLVEAGMHQRSRSRRKRW